MYRSAFARFISWFLRSTRVSLSIDGARGIRYIEIDLLLEIAKSEQRGQQPYAVLALAPADGAPGDKRVSEFLLVPYSSPDNNAQLNAAIPANEDYSDGIEDDWFSSPRKVSSPQYQLAFVEDSVGHDVKLPSLTSPRHKKGMQGE